MKTIIDKISENLSNYAISHSLKNCADTLCSFVVSKPTTSPLKEIGIPPKCVVDNGKQFVNFSNIMQC